MSPSGPVTTDELLFMRSVLLSACILAYCPLVWSRLRPEDLSSKNFPGRTALHIASSLSSKKSTELLVARFLGRSRAVSAPKSLLSEVEEAFSPADPSSIRQWAKYWGYELPYQSSSRNSANRETLQKCFQTLVQDIELTIIRSLLEKGADANDADSKGRTASHLAVQSAPADDDLSPFTGQPDPTIMTLLRYGSHFDSRSIDGFLPIDLAISGSKWAAVSALVGRNAPSTILDHAEISQLSTALASWSLDMRKTAETMARVRRRHYHPSSPLEIYQTEFFLRQCLADPHGSRYLHRDCSDIVELILDIATYWIRTSSQVGAGKHENSPASENGGIRAEVIIDKGRIRKVEFFSLSRLEVAITITGHRGF